MEEEMKKEFQNEPTTEGKINYVIDAFLQRKSALLNASAQTSNPLDRLLIQSKVEEIDMLVSHLKSILK